MNKIKYILIALLFSQSLVLANYNDVYIADIQYDWINKNEVEKEAIIQEIHDIMFGKEITEQNNLKSQFKDKLKDKEHWDNYFAASSGYKEHKDNNISAFYYKKQKNIYMYALQNKKELSNCFYYDALGNLKYIDYLYGDYPDFPYYSIQYRISGKPVSAIYYVSKDTQYLFNPDGTFKGVWYKHNLYDKHSKVILTRTSY